MGCLTRRAFLLSGLAARLRSESTKGRTFPSEWRRYADPTTEFEVLRLTDPAASSGFPPPHTRPAVSGRSPFLLYWSDRTGSPQAFRMDLAKGESRQLTDAAALDRDSLALVPGGRAFCFFNGRELLYCGLSSLRERKLYTLPEGVERCPGLAVSEDGRYALFGERHADGSRLRAVSIAGAAPQTVVQAPFVLSDAMSRPGRAQILYRNARASLWLVNEDGRQNRQLKLAPGGIAGAAWATDGRTVFYLNVPENPSELSAIREVTPDTNVDKLIGKTSQFASFGANRDGSVFVGASRNAGSPTVLLLLRVTRRELTICEHKAGDPAAVTPMFSPDSQRVFFQSDRHGKPAIYSMRVDRLVEKTE